MHRLGMVSADTPNVGCRFIPPTLAKEKALLNGVERPMLPLSVSKPLVVGSRIDAMGFAVSAFQDGSQVLLKSDGVAHRPPCQFCLRPRSEGKVHGPIQVGEP